MKKLSSVMVILFVLLGGCSLFATDFEKGLSKVNEVEGRYNHTIKNYPLDFTQIKNNPITVTDLTVMSKELKGLKEEIKDEALLRLIDFRIVLLEAETYYKLSEGIGAIGDVNDGFGCKDRPFIIEAANYRNLSAQRGYVSVDILKAFLSKYPEEAVLAGVQQSWPVFLNASFYETERKAGATVSFINRVCVKSEAK